MRCLGAGIAVLGLAAVFAGWYASVPVVLIIGAMAAVDGIACMSLSWRLP